MQCLWSWYIKGHRNISVVMVTWYKLILCRHKCISFLFCISYNFSSQFSSLLSANMYIFMPWISSAFDNLQIKLSVTYLLCGGKDNLLSFFPKDFLKKKTIQNFFFHWLNMTLCLEWNRILICPFNAMTDILHSTFHFHSQIF